MTIFYIKRFDGKPSIQISVKTIEVNDIRFKGKRSINWNDVKEYLKEYVGDFYKIASTGDVIYIGSDLPSEYSGSKYTNSLKGANSKAKANAASGLPEMIEIAVGKHFRINQEMKHKRDAKNGWYRYDSKFALPVYGKNVNPNIRINGLEEAGNARSSSISTKLLFNSHSYRILSCQVFFSTSFQHL